MVFLLESSLIATEDLYQSDHRVLGHLPDQIPSPPIAKFGRTASHGVVVFPNFFHLRMEATVFSGTFKAAEMIWYLSSDLCLDTILLWSSTDNSFDLMAWFLL